MLREYWPEELVGRVADGSVSLSRFVPDEWAYSDGTDSGLNQVSQQLYDQEEALLDADDEIHEKFQEQFLETVTLAFEALRNEGVFEPETVCFISMSDDSQASEIEDASARRLNTAEQYGQFKAWADIFNG